MSVGDGGEKRRILHRLRRAHGQLAAVITAVEEDKPCREVVTQLSATSKALDRAGVALISSAMQECLSNSQSTEAEDLASVSEFEKLFMMLT